MPHRKEKEQRQQVLRERAEVAMEKLHRITPDLGELPGPDDARRLLHELRVHQIELELQNEELRRSQHELAASQTRYFDLYELAPVAYCILSEQGVILEANFAVSKLLGIPRKALVLQSLSRFIQKEDQDRYFLHRQQLLKTGEAQAFELAMLRVEPSAGQANEAPFWASLNAMLARDAGDEPIFRIALTDITAIKRAEAELLLLNEDLETRIQHRTVELRLALETLLEEVEERRLATAALEIEKEKFRTVADYTFDWEEWLAPDGSVIYTSPSCERITGYAPREFREDPGLFLRIILPEDTPLLAAEHRTVTEHFDPGELTFRIRTRSGAVRWISHVCQPVYGLDGSWVGQRSSNRDISDKKAAEEEVRRSEEHYSSVVENSPTGICILTEQEILFANQRFFGILMRSPEELASLNPLELVHPEDRPDLHQIWAECLAGNCPLQDHDYRLTGPDDAVRWISGRSTAIQFHAAPAVLFTIQDVSERHQALQALQRSQVALHGLSARLITIQEEERGRVARELHDSIGSTLSAIKLMIETTLQAATQGGKDISLDTLRAVVPVLQDSVEEVRRISMALRPLTLDDLGLCATIEWFLREFQSTHPAVKVAKRIGLTEQEIPDSLKISIFRILQEGLNNAAKHSQAARIDVGLWGDGEQVILELADDGVGFEQAQLRNPDPAVGFGLASMRERAELSGGELSLLTAPGRGTRLRVRWPRASGS